MRLTKYLGGNGKSNVGYKKVEIKGSQSLRLARLALAEALAQWIELEKT